MAPSAGNIQPWEFIVVRKSDAKNRLSAEALNQKSILGSDVVIVVCANENLSHGGYGNRGANLCCLQDTAAAIQNLLLAAHALGLGACWVGAFQEEKVRDVVRAPKGMRPVAMIPIGYPAEKPQTGFRRPLSDLVHYESF
jgi:nitroreductase